MSVPARSLVREEPVPLAARIANGPAEGWTSVALLGIMLLALGVAIDNAGWAGQTAWNASETAFIMPALLLGGLVGFLVAKSRLHWLVAQAAGAFAGGLFVVVAVAGVVSKDPSLSVRLDALLLSVVQFAHDLFVLGIRSSQTSVFLLVLGGACWALGQFSAFVTYRRGRALNAVAATGLFLFVELSVTAKDQYSFLIVYAAAALLFLVRMNLVEQRIAWLRRRIGDSGAVSALYMRGGVTFVAVALGGALALTATASSAPLYGWWRGLDSGLVAWGQQIAPWIGNLPGQNRFPPDLFTPQAPITGTWQAPSDPVFTYTGQEGGQYWMGATYTTFDGQHGSWSQEDRTESPVVPAGGQLLEKSTDSVGQRTGLETITITVTDLGLDSTAVLSPEMPVSVNRAARIYTNGPTGPYAGASFVESLDLHQTYTITARVRATTQAQGAWTAQQLAGASQTYPDWLRPFVQWQGAVGPVTFDTAAGIVKEMQAKGIPTDAFDIAVAVQAYLYKSGGFTYSTTSPCRGKGLVDCFLQDKHGYCEYFATAMTMMLRTQGIPARYVRGYLPGQLLNNGNYEVTGGAAHAWVEVYFPGYGWVRFDPTPGNSDNGQQLSIFPTATPGAGSIGPQDSGIQQGHRTFAPGSPTASAGSAGGVTTTGSGAGPAAPLAIATMLVLLAAALIMTVLSRWRRGPAVAEPEAVYRGVARLAGRFGYGPRPTQTAYEYAGSLGDVLPAVRPELQVVARAKVETSYARRPPRGPAMAALRAAYGRLRLRLLTLVFRRKQSTRHSVGRRERR